MTEWVLAICTASWAMCGSYREFTYPNEQACYRALDELDKRKGEQKFKYIVCSPKSNKMLKGSAHE